VTRLAAVLIFALCFALPLSARAAVPHALGLEAGPSPNVVEVAGRCGPGRHYVRGHHSRRTGRWIRGHCVRNHYRR
jgi:hypothetical protein